MQPSGRPVISVLIPTRERLVTLRSTLRTALDQRSDAIEVLVCDNASSDGTAEFVASVGDSRLRYVNSGRRISMSSNWDLAVEHSRGEYILIIGDDDAVMPGVLDRLVLDLERVPSDVYVWPKHLYVWPSSGQDAYIERLAVPTEPGWVELASLSRFVLRMGGWRWGHLPTMYHSLVARRIPDAIRRQHGRVFRSAGPDIFMSLAIPAFTAAAWNVGYIVTAHGRSPKANGWVVSSKDQPNGLIRHLSEYGEYEVHPTLYPGRLTLANLTGDAVLVARDLFADHYKSVSFGYEAMWAFACREALTFKYGITPRDVVRDRRKIRKYHHLSLPRFAAYLALQTAAEVRARLMAHRTRRKAAADIATFVQEVSPPQERRMA